MVKIFSMSDNTFDREKRQFIEFLVETGGPELHDYEKFTNIVNCLNHKYLDEFRGIVEPILNINTLIGHGYTKPFGYPGDFSLIDHIYSFHISENKKYRNWDIFFQNQQGAIAVRNRKEYFLNQCKELVAEGHGDKKILILGSGPATDVNEFLNSHTGNNISFDLVDFDQNAIVYSSSKNKEFENNISYFRVNVLRFEPYKMYDLIWSAGLFDYFKDKHFIYLVRKYINYLKAGGEFVIGNFSPENPTKNLMEVLSDWYLNYRDRHDLLEMAREAGLVNGRVSIDAEALEVNLFLKIKGG
jgi:extracellular factor (EF) 3-hydroxypalmitic acid methyl ester biosynthesis protein